MHTQQEHQCQFIFRFAALDLGAVATGFALLRLPKMAELKGAPPASFKADAQDDTAAIEFKDKRREKARQARLVVQAAENKQVLLTVDTANTVTSTLTLVHMQCLVTQ
jgi:ATP-dependent RNA helicase DDX55/SPB4